MKIPGENSSNIVKAEKKILKLFLMKSGNERLRGEWRIGWLSTWWMQANIENSAPLWPLKSSQNTVKRGGMRLHSTILLFLAANVQHVKQPLLGKDYHTISFDSVLMEKQKLIQITRVGYSADRKGGWLGRHQPVQMTAKAFQETWEAGKKEKEGN